MVSLLIAGVLAASAQSSPTPPPELKQFDFWIGEWTCSGELYSPNAAAQKTSGQNSIKRILDGQIVQENFSMPGLVGMSVSAYVPAAKQWRQTWVDNSGSYIHLTGGFKDGKMILATPPRPNGQTSRMVFHNIKPDSFDWDWEGSKDSGKTWKLNWHLHYTRKPA